VQFDVFCAGF